MLIPPIGSFLWSLNDEKSLNNTHTTKQQKRTNNGFRNTKNHPAYLSYLLTYLTTHPGGTLEMFGWGCAAGTLGPLAYTRARSSEFCYPILDLSPKIPPIPVKLFSRNYRGHKHSPAKTKPI